MSREGPPAGRTTRRGGAAVRPGWTAGGEAAREATFQRLQSLAVEVGPVDAGTPGGHELSSGFRSVDDELAALVYDSMADTELLASVRSGGRHARQLTFEAPQVTLEIEVSSGRRLVGQVVPPQAAVVELRHRSGTTPVATDELGCFHVREMPDGPVSFRCCPSGGEAHSVATSWIAL